MKESIANSERMERCAGFHTCNAPKCPLDDLYDERTALPGEPVCKGEKPMRVRIGLERPQAKYFGLTRNEWSGYSSVYPNRSAIEKALREAFERGI